MKRETPQLLNCVEVMARVSMGDQNVITKKELC